MTTSYEATGRNCSGCGHPLEDYAGHLQASEIAACEDCHDDLQDEYGEVVDIVHSVPRKEDPV